MNYERLHKWLLALSFLAMYSFTMAQVQLTCMDPITICRDQWNTIDAHVVGDSIASLRFGETEITDFEVSGKSIVFLATDLPNPATGIYTVSTADGNACWGTYTIPRSRYTYLVESLDSVCMSIDAIGPTTPSGEVLFHPYVHIGGGQVAPSKVCQGQRLNFGVTSAALLPDYYVSLALPPNDTLNESRLDATTCTIEYINNFDFGVYFDQVGEAAIFMQTLNEVGCSSTNYNFLEVLPSTKNEIAIDGQTPTAVTICTGEEVLLSSVASINSKYTVSDGRVFNQSEAPLSFTEAGTYSVVLSGESRCECIEADTLTITVLAGESTAIECVGSVCPGETSIYYSSLECDSYVWSVDEAGTVISGGGLEDAFVEVTWDGGLSVGNISLLTPSCASAGCSSFAEEAVNILTPDIGISGPSVVCSFASDYYSIPDIDADIHWTVSHGEIFNGQGTNVILVKWKYPQKGLVTVTYDNCLLGCEGTSVKEVDVTGPILMYYDANEICLGNEVTFYANANQLTWEIQYPDNTIETISDTARVSALFSTAGTYIIKVMSDNSNACRTTDSTVIEIELPPEPAADILGFDFVCEGISGLYTVPSLTADQTVLWQVYDGTTTTATYEVHTRELTYLWRTAGPYALAATVVDINSGCGGTAYLETYEFTSSIVGSETLCVGEEADYTFDASLSDSYSWSIDPPSAGSWTSNPDGSISVTWSRVGTHLITRTSCGYESQLTVEVSPPTSLNASYTPYVCRGESAWVAVSSPSGTGAISIQDASGAVVASDNPALLPAGTYVATANSSSGCEPTVEIEIREYPDPQLFIFAQDPLFICNPGEEVRLLSEEKEDIASYQWYLDGALYPNTAENAIATATGTYYVSVVDTNGCTGLSNEVEIYDCSTGSGNNLPSGGIMSFSISCVELQFELNPPLPATASYNWTFGDPASGADNTSSLPSPIHNFTHAGYFHLWLNTSNPNFTFYTIVEIPVVPRIQFDNTCFGSPMQFYDASSKIQDLTGLNYLWDFGDTASGSSNTSSDQDPQHSFSSPGTYTVTLEVTAPSGCTSSTTTLVEVSSPGTIDFSIDGEQCESKQIEFTAITFSDVASLSWNFGDGTTDTGEQDNSTGTRHIYYTAGSYEVQLLVTNSNGCQQQVTKQLEIFENPSVPDVSILGPTPLCPGSSVELSLPNGMNSYVWSTGVTTPTISVTEPGQYSALGVGLGGCAFSTNTVLIQENEVADARITGIVYSDLLGAGQQTYEDSITVCLGQRFDLRVTNLSQASYLWSPSSSTETNLFYYDHFEDLSTGRYEYTVQIEQGGCMHETSFVINIVAPPPIPAISASTETPCEGSVTSFSVSNADPSLTYTWNTGQQGTQMSSSSAGEYWVTAINQIGCEVSSESITIAEVPSINGWLKGCREVCFPQSLCLSAVPSTTYELVQDEQVVTQIVDGEVPVLEPGAYQILATSAAGCQTLSDYLVLDAQPDDHTVDGTVYLDDNMNMLLDGIDVGIEGVTVYLMLGSTVLDSTVTDSLGYYIFEDLEYPNLAVVIDPSDHPLQYSGDMDSLLYYDNCVESKEVNFPLTPRCELPLSSQQYFTCPGEDVMIDSNWYTAGDLDTLSYTSADNCDSSVVVEVLPFVEPTVAVEVSVSCTTDYPGQLSISAGGVDSLLYSIDGGQTYFTDSIIDSLPFGEYILLVTDTNLCTAEEVFSIPDLEVPEVLVITTPSCPGAATGTALISAVSGAGLLFKLSTETSFSSNLELTGLATGIYELLILDQNGCETAQVFTIEEVPAIVIEVTTKNTCIGEQNGTVTVVSPQSGVTFSLDGMSSFSEVSFYENIQEGDHVLYIMSQEGCLDSTLFEIQAFDSLAIAVKVQNACDHGSTGTITLSSGQEGVSYALNGAAFSADSVFADVPVGQYTVAALSADGCSWETDVEIAESPQPTIDLLPSATCPGEENGAVTIQASSLTATTYHFESEQIDSYTTIEGLASGNYTIRATTEEGCTYEYPFVIEEVAVSALDITAIAACEGQENGVIQVVLGADVSATLSDGTTSVDGVFENLAAGVYTVAMTFHESGCTLPQEITVPVLPPLQVTVPEVDNDCNTSALTITPVIEQSSGNVSYQWSDGATTNSQTIDTNGDYRLTVSDECSEAVFEWSLTFDLARDRDAIQIANIFSPNNDNVNDCVTATAMADVDVVSYTIDVYDRWGNLVYKSTDISSCWDGNFSGRPVAEGVYVYMIRYSISSCDGVQTHRKVGDITVLR